MGWITLNSIKTDYTAHVLAAGKKLKCFSYWTLWLLDVLLSTPACTKNLFISQQLFKKKHSTSCLFSVFMHLLSPELQVWKCFYCCSKFKCSKPSSQDERLSDFPPLKRLKYNFSQGRNKDLGQISKINVMFLPR